MSFILQETNSSEQNLVAASEINTGNRIINYKEKGKMINNYCRGSEKCINIRRRVYINIYIYVYLYIHICTTTKRVEAGQGDEAD